MLFCPVGCVNTIIYNLYKMRGIQPTKAVAGMMLSAIISDTVLFRSPTTTDKDREAVKELAELAGVDYEQYGMEMLKAGADISDYSAEQLASNDRKEFESAGNTFTVGQISVMDVAPINAKKDAIMAVLEKNKAEKGYVASYLMVTDILAEDTFLWFTDGAQEIVEAAFEKKADNQCVYLPKVMSRKKQVSPPLINAYAK